MLRAVTDAGVFHAYLENVVFNPDLLRMRDMVEAGSLGRLTTVRSREGHSGPHAAHFWDATVAGGGALLDMASHGTEVARFLFGKDLAATEVFAWGDTLVHRERTTGEDNAVMIIRFADGRAASHATSRGRPRAASRAASRRGATPGARSSTSASAPMKAFVERAAGYLVEKADADTGWVFPVPDEVRVHGHDAMMADVVGAFRDGRRPTRDVRRRATSSTRSSTPRTGRCAAGTGRRSCSTSRSSRGSPRDDSRADRVTALVALGDLDPRGGARARPDRRDAGRRHRARRAPGAPTRSPASGLVHLFGTGHSRIPVEEMFPRYGSYPGLPPDRRAVDDLPHPGGRLQRAAPGDVHRAGPGPGRGDPVQLHLRARRT